MTEQQVQKRRFYRRKGFLWPVGVFAGLVVGVIIAVNVSPWPGNVVIRKMFEMDADKTTKALDKHAPQGISLIANQQYRDGDSDAYLDVYFPESTAANAALPTVIWTHGGAWVAGNKSNYNGYYELIADKGYTVVSLDYSLGPGKTYPTAVHQLNEAHAYLLANAERLHIDPNNIVLAGDSAGAQLSSQLATLVTSPDYAHELGIAPALTPAQLRGVVLNCGIYDVPEMLAGKGVIGWGVDQVLWAYTGARSPGDSLAGQQMSTINHVTGAFPPAYISGGNGDPLTDTQSKPLAAKLVGLGVDVDGLFFAADYEPKLPHEYQFNLDDAAGPQALQRTLDFLAKVFTPA